MKQFLKNVLVKGVFVTSLLVLTIGVSGCGGSEITSPRAYCDLSDPQVFSDNTINVMTERELVMTELHNDTWMCECHGVCNDN